MSEGWVWVSDRRKILPNTKQPDTHKHPESGDLRLSLILSQHSLGLGFPRCPRDDWIGHFSAPFCFIPLGTPRPAVEKIYEYSSIQGPLMRPLR